MFFPFFFFFEKLGKRQREENGGIRSNKRKDTVRHGKQSIRSEGRERTQGGRSDGEKGIVRKILSGIERMEDDGSLRLRVYLPTRL